MLRKSIPEKHSLQFWASKMRDIKDFNLQEIRTIIKNWGYASFHAAQIFSWIYKRGIADFAQMSDLPFDLRKKLSENYYPLSLKIIKRLKSSDGTEKFLFSAKDASLIEAVCIPTEKRMTGCISTQVGCKFGCQFCASGLAGFKRNLTCAEMIEEVLFLKNNSEDKKLTHLVFMGIGEPLDNYDNLLKAIRIINSEYSFNIGARRITISTCGIIPGLKRLANENLQVELSISLHAADEKTRSLLMPINKKYPLRELIPVCKEYIKKTKRQITFEYILIKDLNLDLQSAANLVKILRDLKLAKVNLIPCNPIRELARETPAKEEISFFKNYLLKQGINLTLRKPRGQDIEAACGQLRLRYEKK